MSKIIRQRITLANPSDQQSTPNPRTICLLLLDHHQIANVQTHDIIVFNTITQTVVFTFQLPFEICQIVYNRQHKQFIMIPKCQDLTACQIYTLSYSSTPTLKSYYRYEDNKPGAK